MSTTTTTTRSLLAASLLAVSLGLGALDVGTARAQDPAGCDEPYAPVFRWRQPPSTDAIVQEHPERPVDVPDLYGQGIGAPDPGRTPDTDGDGVADRVAPATVDGRSAVAIARGGGDLVLALPDHDVTTTSQTAVGDLDGDGRDEVFLLAAGNLQDPGRAFVVPGATPDGQHRLDEIAIEVPGRAFWLPAGDAVAGPGDDLVVVADGATRFVSGGSIMAAGPGGSAAFDPDPSSELEGTLVGVFDLGEDRPAVLTQVVARPGGIDGRLLLLRDGRVQEFAVPGFPDRFAVVVHQGRRLLRASLSTRSGSGGSMWDIDEPCRPLAAASGPPAPPGSPPATPRPGSAVYTG